MRGIEGRILPTAGLNTEPLQYPDVFLRNSVESIVSGRSHTLGRAAYSVGHNGREQ